MIDGEHVISLRRAGELNKWLKMVVISLFLLV